MGVTCLRPVSCISKDSGCRVSSCVSAGVILACGPVFGIVISSSCLPGFGKGEILVPLLVHSAESLRILLWFSSISLMNLLEKGIDGDIDSLHFTVFTKFVLMQYHFIEKLSILSYLQKCISVVI